MCIRDRYTGEQLVKPSRSAGKAEIFVYLDGDVVHCKVINEGHGATHGVSEDLLLEFLNGRANLKE